MRHRWGQCAVAPGFDAFVLGARPLACPWIVTWFLPSRLAFHGPGCMVPLILYADTLRTEQSVA